MENAVSPETQEVTPGSPEYNALMVEKFEESQKVVEEAPSQRPDWLPEKFATPEDLAKAYAELERKQSTKQPQGSATETETPSIDKARDVVQSAGVDFDALSAEFAANDGLTEASYKMLESKGFPRELVDDFIEGQRAQAQLFRTEILADVGGDEVFNDMVQWAAQNFTRAEIEAFNEQVESRNLTKAKMAVAGLKARYEAAVGTEPKLLGGNAAEATDVFRSTAELTAAMRDPRYKKDPAYRADVAAKLARSDIY